MISKLKIVGFSLWGILIVALLLNKDKLTVETLTNILPENIWIAIICILLAFALKSLTFVFYSGIISAVTGVILPFWPAVLVNCIGVLIMFTIPYTLGRSYGKGLINQLVEEHPKLSIINTIYVANDTVFSMLLRMVKLINYDILSMYMGARGIKYKEFLLGSLIALLPEILATTFAGFGISQGNYKYAWVFIVVEAVSTIVALSLIYFFRKDKGEGARSLSL